MFGFGASTGFGQSQAAPSPFGAAPASPFGAPAAAPAFGQQQPSAFGAPAAGSPFGASQPAFGAASTTPAFGAASTAFGGSSAFGAARPTTTGFGGFGGTTFGGAPSQPAFGAASAAPAFGQQPAQTGFGITAAPSFGLGGGPASQPAFGAAPAASPFGGSTFGATPAFGGAPASQPAFGAPAAAPSPFGAPAAGSPFGGTTSNVFGAPQTQSPGAFGAQPAAGGLFGGTQPAAGGMFGAQPAANSGSRAVPYQKTIEKDGNNSQTGQPTNANFLSISAMPAYANKSPEELRWEDYQAGVKSAAAGPPAPAASPFGASSPAAAPSAFGMPQQASPTGFGAASQPFGASTSTGGLFGTQQTNAFGAPAQQPGAFGAAASPFGAPSQPAFGAQQSAPAFGNAFGQPSSAPAFGAATGSAFGASTGSSLFGSTTPAFGAAPQSSASAFSFNTTPSLFGGSAAAPSAFGASPFGASSAATSSPGLFGSASSPSPFGGTSTPAFGAAGSSPFGGAFGAKPAQSSAFGGTSLFGTSSGGGFGTSTFGSTGGGFGAGGAFGSQPASQPTSLFGSQPSLFGGNTSPSMFGSGSSFAPASNALAPQPFGQQQAGAQAQPASVTQTPYGSFPALPAVPEPKVGISNRATRTISVGASSARASPLLSLRNTASSTPKLGVQIRHTSLSPLGSLGAGATGTPLSPAPSANNSALTTPGSGMAMLQPRSNPHRLFIREPPPGTEAAAAVGSSSPALTPARGTRSWTPPPMDASPHNPFSAFNGADADGHADNDRPPLAASPRPAPRAANGTGNTAQARESTASHLPSLGRLAAEGYTYEPSATQLDAMYQSDPHSLHAVSNFTVTRPGVGSIRWLHPVDVFGLKLDGIINIQQGEVICYGDGDKPPVGQGLNTDAEISLYNVHKIDSATQTPVRDGVRLAKWEKALRAMCARMGAKFVSYKPDGGVWKFEVEHFSRYGLLPEDEEDEDEIEVSALPAGRQPATRFGLSDGNGHADEMGSEQTEELLVDGEGDDMEEQQGQEYSLIHIGGDSDGPAFGVAVDGPQASDAETLAGTAPLQHTLPARLALNPTQMAAMRDSFFSGTQQPSGNARAGTLALASAPGAPVAVSPWNAMEVDASVSFGAQSGVQPQAVLPSPHAWRRSPAPLSTMPGPSATSRRGAAREDEVDEPGSAMPLALTIGSPLASAMSASRPGTSTSQPLAVSAGDAHPSSSFVDAGLALGTSFRVGWGPGGVLVVPGPPPQSVGMSAQSILIKRVKVEGSGGAYDEGDDEDDSEIGSGGALDAAPVAGLPARLAALRARLRTCLQVHAQHSHAQGAEDRAQAEGSAGQWRVPRRRLQCSSRAVAGLVSELVSAAEHAMSAAGVGEEEFTRVAHEADTWKLLQVLFAHIEPSVADSALEGQDADMNPEDSGGVAALRASTTSTHSRTASVSDATLPAPLLAAFERHAGISRWLQRQASPRVERALGAVSSPPEAVLQLLSGRQLVGAAAVAAASGDTRLATLIASAGQHAQAQAELTRQLDLWAASDMTSAVAADRLLVYRLLAGQVLEANTRLKLDWRRFLGLLVWYHNPASSTAGANSSAVRHQAGHVAAAVRTYTSLLAEQGSASAQVPLPLPHYVEEELLGGSGHASLGAMSSVDVQFALLQLWATQQLEAEGDDGADAERGGAAPSQPPFATLLAASGHSANPCDAWLAWSLMTVLQALGVLQQEEGTQEEAASDMLLSAHMNLIMQLLLAGGLAEWAVYVATLLPDSAPGWEALGAGKGLRAHVVSELLARTAPEWVGDARKEAFLRDTLQLPAGLLADAAAAWARYRHDAEVAVRSLITAGAWSAAHDLLVRRVAPALVMSNRLGELSSLVGALAPHAAALPEWLLGGGLYEQYIAAFGPAASAPGAPRASREALQALSAALAAATAALRAGGAGAVVEGEEQVVVSARAGPTTPSMLQQRVVLARMAARVHGELMRHLAEASLKGHQAGHTADGATDLLHSALALCGAEPALRAGAVGASMWHLGGALMASS